MTPLMRVDSGIFVSMVCWELSLGAQTTVARWLTLFFQYRRVGGSDRAREAVADCSVSCVGVRCCGGSVAVQLRGTWQSGVARAGS